MLIFDDQIKINFPTRKSIIVNSYATDIHKEMGTQNSLFKYVVVMS